MARQYYTIVVKRAGAPIAGSPFVNVLYFTKERFPGREGEIAPHVTKLLTPTVLCLPVTATPSLGDLVYAADGTTYLGKISNIKGPYSNGGLQCDVVCIPYTLHKVFIPKTQAQQIQPDTVFENDVLYVAADPTTTLAYIEPLTDGDKLMLGMRVDSRAGKVYANVPITQGTILSDGSFLWECSASEFYPGTLDYLSNCTVKVARVSGCTL